MDERPFLTNRSETVLAEVEEAADRCWRPLSALPTTLPSLPLSHISFSRTQTANTDVQRERKIAKERERERSTFTHYINPGRR